MEITPKELEFLKSYTQQLKLSVVDGLLQLNNEPLDLFPYLLNKYRGLHDIHIDFTSQGIQNNNKGTLSVYDNNYTVIAGDILVNENNVKFLVDGFIFENDEFCKHVLEMNSLKQNSKDFSMTFNYEKFGKYRLRCGMNNSTILMRMLGAPLNQPKFNFPYFNYEESRVIKDNTVLYETTGKNKIEEVDKYRSLYVTKIHELMKTCQFEKGRLINIRTTINLNSADILFDTNFILNKTEQRKMLEYVFNHYDEINVPLYSSIIKKSENFTAKTFQTDVNFNSREIIKNFLDLTDMATI
jgi:hypothetical protein